jgi:hypothetical protein
MKRQTARGGAAGGLSPLAKTADPFPVTMQTTGTSEAGISVSLRVSDLDETFGSPQAS